MSELQFLKSLIFPRVNMERLKHRNLELRRLFIVGQAC